MRLTDADVALYVTAWTLGCCVGISDFIKGMLLWWPVMEFLSWCPIYKSSHCNSCEDLSPAVDFTWRGPNLNSLRPIDAYMCLQLIIIGSDNGLSPGRHQAIIWTKAGILLIGPLGTKFSEIWIEILISSFTKVHFKMSSKKGGHFSSMC